jgi:hypothetical protein
LPDDPKQVEFGRGGLGGFGVRRLGHGGIRMRDGRTLILLDRLV